MKFRKKPIVIEAEQWDKDKLLSEPFFICVGLCKSDNGNTCVHCKQTMHDHGWINTLEGEHRVCPGDWIIKGIKGEFYPCKPDIFEQTYEKVEE